MRSDKVERRGEEATMTNGTTEITSIITST